MKAAPISDSAPGATPVLLFHRVGAVPLRSAYRGLTAMPSMFRNYAGSLAKLGYVGTSLRASRLCHYSSVSKEHPSKQVIFTFDDAYAGVYRHALPALEKRGWSATVFVVSGRVGQTSSWMENADGRHRLMSWQEILSAQQRGFEIGSHTVTHAHLTQLSDHEARIEILDSKKTLEDRLGEEVKSFAYPYGEFDERILGIVAEAGYSYAVSTRKGVSASSSPRLALPRIAVSSWRLSTAKFLNLIENAPVDRAT